MWKKILIACVILITFSNCKTRLIERSINMSLGSTTSLLQVGFKTNKVFESSGELVLERPIKISFSMQSFKESTDTKKSDKESKVTSNKQYLTLTISDKVAVIEALNQESNKHLKSFLALSSKRKLVTSISLTLQEAHLLAVQQAEEVFLVPYGVKSYALNLYTNKKVTQQILFHDTVFIASKTSSICWQENKKHQLKIVDLVDGNKGCPSNTYKNSIRAQKKINYYKF